MPQINTARKCLKYKLMTVPSDRTETAKMCSGTEKTGGVNHQNRHMFSPWIYLTGLIVILLQLSTPVTSEQILVWSQHSHKWTKLRGLFGKTDWQSPSRKRFVTSESSRDKIFDKIAYDARTRYLYWHDMTTKSIYRQNINDSLVQRMEDNIELVFEETSGVVGGLAVDWFGGNIIWADQVKESIFMSRKHKDGPRLSRLIVSGVNGASGVAADPTAGRIYWGTKENQHPRIETATFIGDNRMTLAQYPDIGAVQCLTLESSTNSLYFVHDDPQGYGSVLHRLDPSTRQLTKVRDLGNSNQYSAIAADKDYIYLLLSVDLELVVLNKLGEPVYEHVIDAIPHDIIVTNHPNHEVCEEDTCSHFCVSLGAASDSAKIDHKCPCADGYIHELDGRTCSSSKPRYIYSVDGQLWDLDAELPEPYTSGEGKLTRLATDYKQIEAIGFHYELDLVYFSDTINNAIYRGEVEYKSFIEHTVNEYNVQGISVCWLAKTVYWADGDLGHIMLSQLDGRYHKVLMENIGKPKGLTVDAINGFLYFIESEQSSIIRTKTDGTDRKQIIFGLAQPHAIVADPRIKRIFWIDGGQLKSAGLDGNEMTTEMTTGPSLGLTLWQEILTYSFGNAIPQFAQYKRGLAINMNTVPASHDLNTSKFRTYDVITYNNYLQPALLGPCLNNGDCQQLCYPMGKEHTCGCAIGYSLDADKKTCNTKVSEYNYVLFMDPYHKALYLLDTKEGKMTSNAVPITTMDRPIAFDLDHATGKIYWIDEIKKSIRSSFTNGLDEKTVWDFDDGYEPMKLLYNHVSKAVFFLDQGKEGLFRISEEGKDLTPIVSNIARPSSLVQDIEKKLIYFATKGTTIDQSRIAVVSTDGSGERDLLRGNYPEPSALAFHETDKILYWVQGDTIKSMEAASGNPRADIYVSGAPDIITLAVDDVNLYFTRHSNKSVYKVSRNATQGQAEALDKPVFARITDVRAYPGVRLIPPPPPPGPAQGVPVLWLGIGVAAAVLLALLLLLLALCFVRKKRKPPPPVAAASHNGGGFGTQEVERGSFDMFNSTIHDPSTNGIANGGEPVYTNVNGYTNGDIPPPVITSSAPELTNGRHHISDHNGDPTTNFADEAMVVASMNALKPTKKYEKNSKRNPRNDPNSFNMDGGKVATVIQRIANRLRTGLDSIRWSGDPDGRSSRGRSSLPPQDIEKDVEPKAEDTAGANKFAKNKQVIGPTRPMLHRQPIGYAPASRVTPSHVKNTVRGAKH